MDIFHINPAATLLVSGEIDDWGAVCAHRVDAVIDMDGDVDFGLPRTPGGLLYIYYPIFDDDLPDLPKLDALGRMVAELIEAGRIVLIHCRMGFNRSMLVAATALSYLGRRGPDILTHMRQVRPGALFNERFAEHVKTLPARRVRVEALGDPPK